MIGKRLLATGTPWVAMGNSVICRSRTDLVGEEFSIVGEITLAFTGGFIPDSGGITAKPGFLRQDSFAVGGQPIPAEIGRP